MSIPPHAATAVATAPWIEDSSETSAVIACADSPMLSAA
jgi:hypothetical protein